MLYAFTDVPSEVIDKYLNIGIVVFTKLCQEVIPLMKEERLGGKAMMVNLGSAAGELATPYLGVYAGTKGYMLVSQLIIVALRPTDGLLPFSTSFALTSSHHVSYVCRNSKHHLYAHIFPSNSIKSHSLARSPARL